MANSRSHQIEYHNKLLSGLKGVDDVTIIQLVTVIINNTCGHVTFKEHSIKKLRAVLNDVALKRRLAYGPIRKTDVGPGNYFLTISGDHLCIPRNADKHFGINNGDMYKIISTLPTNFTLIKTESHEAKRAVLDNKQRRIFLGRKFMLKYCLRQGRYKGKQNGPGWTFTHIPDSI